MAVLRQLSVEGVGRSLVEEADHKLRVDHMLGIAPAEEVHHIALVGVPRTGPEAVEDPVTEPRPICLPYPLLDSRIGTADYTGWMSEGTGERALQTNALMLVRGGAELSALLKVEVVYVQIGRAHV